MSESFIVILMLEFLEILFGGVCFCLSKEKNYDIVYVMRLWGSSGFFQIIIACDRK